MFEVVFDYGEHDAGRPDARMTPADWPVPPDPFSSYRAGFEVRTYRLCRRVLMFHHFPERSRRRRRLPGPLHSTSPTRAPSDPRLRVQPDLRLPARRSPSPAIDAKPDATATCRASLPPLEFEYTEPIIDDRVREVDAGEPGEPARGRRRRAYRWVDLRRRRHSGHPHRAGRRLVLQAAT